jgi:organic radical activating enzyme
MNDESSFTSANALPVKLFGSAGAMALRPIHIQWTPTNACNLNCRFCSCSARDKSLDMEWPLAAKVIRNFADLGCKAATITGGGEPLLHPQISNMVDAFCDCGIKVGLVTNGLLLWQRRLLTKATWCRISHSDAREFNEEYQRDLQNVVVRTPIDWAFSYVVSPEPRLEEIAKIVTFAEANGFTHVRLVADLFEPGNVPWDAIRERLKGMDRLVIYQPRTATVPATRCLLAYVKPVVGPDFKMYYCCGVQYAQDPPARDYPDALCMGSALDLDKIYAYPHPFKVACKRCYYDDYNRVLLGLRSLHHAEFV